MQILYVYLIIYVALLLAISYFISRKQSPEDYLIGNRDRGGWQILMSKFAAAIGVGYFITYTGFAYEYGFGVFALLLGLIIGYLLFGYWAAPKIHPLSKENNFYTIGDFVYYKTKNKLTKHVANWFAKINLFIWLIVGMVGGSKIIQEFGFVSYEAAVVITSLVILSYILLAGFRAVLITDVIQSVIIIILMFIVTFGVIGHSNIGSLFSANTQNIDPFLLFGFLAFGILAVFSQGNFYQLIYAAKTKEKARAGLSLAVIPIMLVAFLLMFIGLFMAINSPGVDSGLVFAEALRNFLPASLIPLAVVLFFAGVMSSEDTDIYTIASHFAKERKGDFIKNTKKSTIVVVILAFFVSLIFRDVVDVSIIAGGASVILSFPLIYLIKGGTNPKRFFGSFFLGLVALIVGLILGGANPQALAPAVVFSALGLLWK